MLPLTTERHCRVVDSLLARPTRATELKDLSKNLASSTTVEDKLAEEATSKEHVLDVLVESLVGAGLGHEADFKNERTMVYPTAPKCEKERLTSDQFGSMNSGSVFQGIQPTGVGHDFYNVRTSVEFERGIYS